MSKSVQISLEKVGQIYKQPLLELIYQAQAIHRQHFSNKELEACALLSIKTGACPEDCGYCSQSGHHQTDLEKEKILNLDKVIEKAKIAKEEGAVRFCMGAAWRSPPAKDFPKVVEMIKAVKSLGLETCVTLGMLEEEQAMMLKEAGLDFYNHNLDTSPQYYSKVTTTRTQKDRINTLHLVAKHGIQVCCGGILGMGEAEDDRIELLYLLTTLKTPPKSIPINQLVKVPGTPLYNANPVDWSQFVRTIATARCLFPTSIIRLSAGRGEMDETYQVLCFLAGANSIWLGDKYLTAPNSDQSKDMKLLEKLGMKVTSQLESKPKDIADALATN